VATSLDLTGVNLYYTTATVNNIVNNTLTVTESAKIDIVCGMAVAQAAAQCTLKSHTRRAQPSLPQV
jgi:hypothetical protein